jgi:hypothetical protein
VGAAECKVESSVRREREGAAGEVTVVVADAVEDTDEVRNEASGAVEDEIRGAGVGKTEDTGASASNGMGEVNWQR